MLLLRTKLRHFLKCSYPGGGDDDGAGPAIGGVALRLRERFQRNDFTETKLLPKDLFLVSAYMKLRIYYILYILYTDN